MARISTSLTTLLLTFCLVLLMSSLSDATTDVNIENIIDEVSSTAFRCIESNDNETLILTLPKLTQLDSYRDSGFSLLSYACSLHNYNAVSSLLSLGANPNTADDLGNMPLSVSVGDIALENLLIKAGADPSFGSGLSSMHWLIWNTNYDDFVKMLNDDYAINATDNTYKYSPLHIACLRPHVPMKFVVQLLRHGAATELCDYEGATPLLLAAAANSPGKIRILLDYGANPDVRDSIHGYTPLHWAANNNDYQSVFLLLAAGATITITDYSNNTAYDVAMENGNTKLASILYQAQ